MNKLLEFQRRVEAIKKDAKNPFFKSNYFDINSLLAEIKPLLSELGLVLTQPLYNKHGRNTLDTDISDSETGDVLISSSILLPDLQDPQKMGSAITYYRRYSLQSLLALQAEDDDGNLAAKKEVIDPRKEQIVKLCRSLGYYGNDFKEYVFKQTAYTLEEKNFDVIIENLTKIDNLK